VSSVCEGQTAAMSSELSRLKILVGTLED